MRAVYGGLTHMVNSSPRANMAAMQYVQIFVYRSAARHEPVTTKPDSGTTAYIASR